MSHCGLMLLLPMVTPSSTAYLLPISRQSPQPAHPLSHGNADKVVNCNQNAEGLGGREGKSGANKLRQLLNVTVLHAEPPTVIQCQEASQGALGHRCYPDAV